MNQRTGRRRNRLVFLILGAVLGVLGITGAPAGASAPPPPTTPADDTADDTPVNADELTWSVRPTPTDAQPDRPNFQFDLEPGVTLRDSLRIRNYGPEPLPLVIYASDALTTSTGAMDLLPASDAPSDLGAWITLDQTGTVTVPAQSTLDVPFTLTVPANATPGDHSGGIVTSYVSPVDNGNQTVVVDRRLANRVQVRVAGELDPQLTLSDVTVDYQGTPNPFGTGTATVRYTVTNTGNVRLAADQMVTIAGRFGLPGREATLEPLPELLPGNSLTYVAEIPDVWPVLRADATVTLTPTASRAGDTFEADTPAVSTTVTTWAVPWTLLVLLAVVILLPLYSRWSRRRRERQQAQSMQQMMQQTVMMAQVMQATMGQQPAAPQIPPAVPPPPARSSAPDSLSQK